MLHHPKCKSPPIPLSYSYTKPLLSGYVILHWILVFKVYKHYTVLDSSMQLETGVLCCQNTQLTVPYFISDHSN